MGLGKFQELKDKTKSCIDLSKKNIKSYEDKMKNTRIIHVFSEKKEGDESC